MNQMGIVSPFCIIYFVSTYSSQHMKDAICGCQKFQHRIGHVPIREKGEYGPDLCVGDVEPKTLLQVR
jgi:hypothetical protein